VQDEDDHAQRILDEMHPEGDPIPAWLCVSQIDPGRLVFDELFFNDVESASDLL
jgi:hypothetical protein